MCARIMDDLCKSMTQLHYQMKKVVEIHKNLREFNHVFASFLLGIQLQAECITLDEIIPAPRHISLPNPQNTVSLIDSIASEDAKKQNHKNASSIPKNSVDYESTQNMLPSHTFEKKSQTKSQPRSQPTRKHTLQFVMKKITANIPLAVRDPYQLGEIELLVKILIGKANGEYLNEIYTQCPLDKHRTMQWLNLLVRTQDIVKVSRKGLLYQLNPEKYLL